MAWDQTAFEGDLRSVRIELTQAYREDSWCEPLGVAIGQQGAEPWLRVCVVSER